MTNKIKITIVGSGFVGMSLAVLLAKHNEVVVLDVDPARVNMVNNKQSTVADANIKLAFLAEKELEPFRQLLIVRLPTTGANFVVVATPTNYDPITNRFDTSLVDGVVE